MSGQAPHSCSALQVTGLSLDGAAADGTVISFVLSKKSACTTLSSFLSPDLEYSIMNDIESTTPKCCPTQSFD